VDTLGKLGALVLRVNIASTNHPRCSINHLRHSSFDSACNTKVLSDASTANLCVFLWYLTIVRGEALPTRGHVEGERATANHPSACGTNPSATSDPNQIKDPSASIRVPLAFCLLENHLIPASFPSSPNQSVQSSTPV
jgi:hypothetical protein